MTDTDRDLVLEAMDERINETLQRIHDWMQPEFIFEFVAAMDAEQRAYTQSLLDTAEQEAQETQH